MSKVGFWDDPGPDRGWSWVIALGTCLITFCSYGFSRSCGVLFVATVETFGVTRQEASWPFNLAPAVACFSAIVAGFLSRVLSTRQTVLIGCFLCTLGVSLCFFASSPTWIAVCYGIVYGFGLALCVPLLLGILNEYFLRHRATANGIYLSGSTLGLFSIPPLLEYLVSNYGLQGTMLVMSGLVMHIFIGAILLRSRSPDNFPILERRLKDSTEANKELLPEGPQTRMFRLNSETGSFKADVHNNGDYKVSTNDLQQVDEETGEDKEEANGSQVVNGDDEAGVLVSQVIASKSPATAVRKTSLQRQDTVSSLRVRASIAGSLMLGLDTLGTLTKETEVRVPSKQPQRSYLVVIKEIFLDPCFYLLLVSGAACFIPFLTFMIIVMDFGMDRGLPRDKAVLLMSAISIPELLGRFCFGWISDKGYLKYKTLFMISKTLGAVLLFIMPTWGYFAGLFVLSGIYGAVESCAVTILNVLFVEYIGIEKLPIAFSWSIFIDGFIFLAMPTVIGLFRDTFGSYDYLFYLLGAVNILSVVVWFVEPMVVRKRGRMAQALEDKQKQRDASSA